LGVRPTAQETREFLAACAKARSDGVPESSSDGRSSADTPTLQHRSTPQDSIPPASARDQLIESLLQRPEFVDYWSHKWSDLLLVSSKRLKPAAMWTYYRFIRNNVAANTPWDVFVSKIITAQGSTLENGAGNFYVLHEDPRAMAEKRSPTGWTRARTITSRVPSPTGSGRIFLTWESSIPWTTSA